MKAQQGFTLIELVVVIVILGILAVTAAPKFIDLTGDARVSTLKAMQGAILSGNQMVYSKAIIHNVEQEDDIFLDVGNGDKLPIVYGYTQGVIPAFETLLNTTFNLATSRNDPTPNDEFDGDVGADWTAFDGNNIITIWQVGAPAECKLTYSTKDLEAGEKPVIDSLPISSQC